MITKEEAKATIDAAKAIVASKIKMLKAIEAQVVAAEDVLALAEKEKNAEKSDCLLQKIYDMMVVASQMKNNVDSI